MNEHHLDIEGLTKHYGHFLALDHIDLNLKNGVYGLLGQNGAGKTTLLNILTTVLSYDGGTIQLDGKNIEKMGKGYRDLLGYMPQQQRLTMNVSVRTFLYYMAAMKGIEHKEEKVEGLIKELNLMDHRNQILTSLSGGMIQRVLIAQALLNDPVILLLDEPTAGLDPVERRNFRQIVANCAEGRIVILATHVISDVEFIAENIIMMKHGKVLTVSSQKDLLSGTHVYETDADEEAIMKADPQAVIVNQSLHSGKIYTRFLSDLPFKNQVSANLDDVYLDWLG